jgi:hypothetical protein
MGSTVAAERSRLHDAYQPLRVRILEHYRAVAQLTGREVGPRVYRLPHKLGYWHDTHTDMVLGVCPELVDVVNAIEDLCAARDPHYIRGKHKRQRPGPKPGWMRKGPLNTPGYLHQVGGEYRGGCDNTKL